jgi:hypothetical protein
VNWTAPGYSPKQNLPLTYLVGPSGELNFTEPGENWTPRSLTSRPPRIAFGSSPASAAPSRLVRLSAPVISSRPPCPCFAVVCLEPLLELIHGGRDIPLSDRAPSEWVRGGRIVLGSSRKNLTVRSGVNYSALKCIRQFRLGAEEHQ